jgi:hypothetical protein
MAPSVNRPRGATGSGGGSGSGGGLSGKDRTKASGATGTGASDRPGRHDSGSGKRHDRTGSKGHGLKAAIGRALRATARPDSKTRKTLGAIGRGTVGRTSPAAKTLRATGRGAKAAWNTPARQAATRATARQAKRLRGAAWDGVRSILSGARTLLHRRGGKAALARIRDVWHRRRGARNTPPTPPPASVAASVRRPTATTTTTSTGGTAVSGHHFVASAMEGARAAANYDPKGMLEVGEDFAGLEEALRLHAEAMKVTVENADAKLPLDPRIIEIMRQIHQLEIKAAEMAAELKPAFEKLHDVDLSRLRNPRKGVQGERMWDVTANL